MTAFVSKTEKQAEPALTLNPWRDKINKQIYDRSLRLTENVEYHRGPKNVDKPTVWAHLTRFLS